MSTTKKAVILATGAAALTLSWAFANDANWDNDANWISDEITGAVVKSAGATKAPKVFNYRSVVRKDGTLLVKLDEFGRNNDQEVPDVMTIFAPNVRATEKLLHNQDWYMTVGPNGSMRGIYTVPRNNSLPSSVLRGLDEGYGILRVNPKNSFFKVFPSEYQLASQLTTFSEAARKSVCARADKPESLSASIDVQPGWSGAGRITFDATWKVSDLCKAKPTQ